jgi:hypothetical protein
MKKSIALPFVLFVIIITNSCNTSTSKIDVIDNIGLKNELVKLNKSGYGLFVRLNSNLTKTEELYNYDLILVGEMISNIEFGLVLTGLYNRKRPLFKSITHLEISKDFYSPIKHKPYETYSRQSIIEKEGLSRNRIIKRVEMYPKGAEIKTLLEKYSNCRNCIFIIHKSDTKELRYDFFEIKIS